MNDQRRNRWKLLAIAAVFFTPLIASFVLYYGTGLRPGRSVNHGELLSPARPLPALALLGADGAPVKPDWLHGHWTFLYLGAGSCDADCHRALYNMRQVRLALDREMDRVQRVFLASGTQIDTEFLAREHTGLLVLRADAAAAPLLAQLPNEGAVAPADAHRIYLIDPLGNLVLSYGPEQAGKGMLEDMKRLLKLSSIG